MKRYTIGIDYGTLSVRAVLVDVADGREVACSVFEYPHGVMDKMLPSGVTLGQDWALQHPQDYLDGLFYTVPQAAASVDKNEIIGIGVDFTASTAMPVLNDGTPLCLLPEYENIPHAYVKLWKHHAAQEQAKRITEIAMTRKEKWLSRYGNTVSSEWAIPKVLQLVEEAPDIYEKMAAWEEAGDWIVWQLTGRNTKNASCAGYKGFYDLVEGYPSEDFFEEIHPQLKHFVKEKYNAPVVKQGSAAGFLTKEMAEKLGLREGTVVAAANIDAHVCVPAVGMNKKGQMLAIMGTSTCHMSLSDCFTEVPGICGAVWEGILPGCIGFEAGQSCCGDHFAWFVKNAVPKEYYAEAQRLGVDIHQYMTMLAEKLRPGESGLLALDWWNGNRSILVDIDLSGLLVGLTLQTKPEEIYRALIEATAYGTRMIVENYRNHGVEVNEFFATGGISQKNAMAMQIYADVLNMPIRIAGSKQGAAVGSAVFAAVAAGKQVGGYENISEAAQCMGSVKEKHFEPILENVCIYDKLFA